MRRAVLSAGSWFKHRCPTGRDGAGFWVAFVTLTYRPDVAWSRRHISEYLKRARRQMPPGVPLRYVWVLELTRRGRPHYHVAIWLPVGVKLPKPDQSGAWPHGLSRIERAYAPIGYLLKYTSKGTDGIYRLPRGARLYGSGGLERTGRAHVRWWMLPRYQRVRCSISDHVVRAKGGGWLSVTTGEWWPADPPLCGSEPAGRPPS